MPDSVPLPEPKEEIDTVGKVEKKLSKNAQKQLAKGGKKKKKRKTTMGGWFEEKGKKEGNSGTKNHVCQHYTQGTDEGFIKANGRGLLSRSCRGSVA